MTLQPGPGNPQNPAGPEVPSAASAAVLSTSTTTNLKAVNVGLAEFTEIVTSSEAKAILCAAVDVAKKTGLYSQNGKELSPSPKNVADFIVGVLSKNVISANGTAQNIFTVGDPSYRNHIEECVRTGKPISMSFISLTVNQGDTPEIPKGGEIALFERFRVISQVLKGDFVDPDAKVRDGKPNRVVAAHTPGLKLTIFADGRVPLLREPTKHEFWNESQVVEYQKNLGKLIQDMKLDGIVEVKDLFQVVRGTVSDTDYNEFFKRNFKDATIWADEISSTLAPTLSDWLKANDKVEVESHLSLARASISSWTQRLVQTGMIKDESEFGVDHQDLVLKTSAMYMAHLMTRRESGVGRRIDAQTGMYTTCILKESQRDAMPRLEILQVNNGSHMTVDRGTALLQPVIVGKDPTGEAIIHFKRSIATPATIKFENGSWVHTDGGKSTPLIPVKCNNHFSNMPMAFISRAKDENANLAVEKRFALPN